MKMLTYKLAIMIAVIGRMYSMNSDPVSLAPNKLKPIKAEPPKPKPRGPHWIKRMIPEVRAHAPTVTKWLFIAAALTIAMSFAVFMLKLAAD